MSATTGLAPTGTSRALNASYAGKVAGAATKSGMFSRLHMAGHSRAFSIDSYAGKTPTTPPVDGEGGNFIPVIARRGRRGR